MHKRYRAVPKAVNKGYGDAGASTVKKALKGFTALSGSPQEDIDYNNYTLRQRSRMLYMAAPIATGALKRQRTNIIGSGLRLKSTINRQVLGLSKEQADEWERNVQAEFDLWARRKRACDAAGLNNFYGMQQLIALSYPMSGDVFALVKRYEPTRLMPYSLRLQVIEADRVRTPVKLTTGALYKTSGKAENGNRIFDGVEIDSNGAVTAYYIANTYPLEYNTDEGTVYHRVEAYGKETGLPNIMHIMDSERPEQYRGVPYLAQAIEPLLQMRRYTEAEIMAAVVQSFLTAFITTEASANEIPFNEVGGDDVQEVSRDPNEYEMGVGTSVLLEPGEDVKFSSPTHPNTGFDTFMRALCEQVGACLEIPVDLLMMKFDSSYSASRAALQEAWKAFRMRRDWITDDFCRPVYEIWLTEAVALGRISAPGFLTDPIIREAYLGSEWIGPSQGMLDPTKEVQAATMAIEAGLSTREAEAIKLNGSQYISNIEKLATENELLKEANKGMEVSKQNAKQNDSGTGGNDETPPDDGDGTDDD